MLHSVRNTPFSVFGTVNKYRGSQKHHTANNITKTCLVVSGDKRGTYLLEFVLDVVLGYT